MRIPASAESGPWFHRHPRMALACSAVLFVAATALHAAAGDHADLVALVLVFPVSLVAFSLGLRAGVVASLVSVVLLVGWGVVGDSGASAGEWALRSAPVVLLGVLIGRASDVQRRTTAVLRRLAVAEERQREAAEINDTIVQRLVVAKWSMEAGDTDAGMEAIDEVIRAGQHLVLDLLDGLELTAAERRRTTVATDMGSVGRSRPEVSADR